MAYFRQSGVLATAALAVAAVAGGAGVGVDVVADVSAG